jgi:lysophospholipase L1-like esterase
MTAINQTITWPTLCVFGDSIAEGAGDATGRGWVDCLKAGWRARSRPEAKLPNIYNLGVDGDRTADVLARLIPESKRRSASGIIIAVGINDLPWADGRQATPPLELVSQYENLLKNALSVTPRVLALGPTTIDSARGNHGVQTSDVAALDNLVRSCTARMSALYLNLLATLTANDLADGLHPNTTGHEKLFRFVGAELARLGWDQLESR